MGVNESMAYDMDAHVAEIYDQIETYTDDVALLRQLIAPKALGQRIFEPFCGTGRIVVPLAEDGHEVVGMERSRHMLDRARSKIAELPEDAGRRITLLEGDVLTTPWPEGFDLVLLGGNCFYDVASAEEQERCIAMANAALKPGGHVYVDNDHMEGDLDPAWRRPPGAVVKSFPDGTCADGAQVEATTETVWYDVARRLVRYRRTVTVTSPDGTVNQKEWTEQCHPPSKSEVASWLEHNGFAIEQVYGDRLGNPYRDTSDRAIFWARKNEAGESQRGGT